MGLGGTVRASLREKLATFRQSAWGQEVTSPANQLPSHPRGAWSQPSARPEPRWIQQLLPLPGHRSPQGIFMAGMGLAQPQIQPAGAGWQLLPPHRDPLLQLS
ncbi:unnamed protein product [Natator depressus]